MPHDHAQRLVVSHKNGTHAGDSYLGNVQAGGVNHGVSNRAQRLKLTGFLQQLLKEGRIVFGAVHRHPHGLLTGLIHAVQALTPALHLVFLDQGPGKDLCSQVPA